MILWTLRHTKPYNPKDVCYGRSDFDVAPSFTEEYPPAVQVLRENCRAQRIYSSPLQRCRKLAEKVSEAIKLPVQYADALYELNFGTWENVRLDAVPKEEMRAWKADLRGYRFPEGESFHDMDVRVNQFLRQLLDEESSSRSESEILFVTHAGVIASIEHSICGVPDSNFIEGAFPYAMITRFEIHLENGKPQGTFRTLYGGITQNSLAEIIQKL